MIKDIYSGDPYIDTNVQHRSPYIVDNELDPLNGAVRYRGDRFEVYDSFNKLWIMYTGNSLTLSLNPRAQAAIMWVERKMFEEQQEAELCKKYPALQRAKENFNLMKEMVKNEVV